MKEMLCISTSLVDNSLNFNIVDLKNVFDGNDNIYPDICTLKNEKFIYFLSNTYNDGTTGTVFSLKDEMEKSNYKVCLMNLQEKSWFMLIDTQDYLSNCSDDIFFQNAIGKNDVAISNASIQSNGIITSDYGIIAMALIKDRKNFFVPQKSALDEYHCIENYLEEKFKERMKNKYKTMKIKYDNWLKNNL